MLGRIAFAIFFCLGGFLFYIPYWLIRGTKGSRERKKMMAQQAEILRRTESAS